MKRRHQIDQATLRTSAGEEVLATLLESDDGRPPLVRVSVMGRPHVVGLWAGSKPEPGHRNHVEVELHEL
jgi:hypothetical protein